MLRIFLLFILLLVTWIMLSGHFNAFFILLGIISCALSSFLYYVFYHKKKYNFNINIIGLIIYALWIVKEIFKSSLNISLRMWRLDPEIAPNAQWLKHNLNGETSLLVYANSITLTPGTVTIDTKKGSVYVHSLDQESMDELKGGTMLKLVNKMINKGKK